jgi:hypothetical protein
MPNMLSNSFINMANNSRLEVDEPSQPSEVKIKLKHGNWEVEIACDEARVKEVVERVLSSIDARSEIDSQDLRHDMTELRRELEILKNGPPTSRPGLILENLSKSNKGGMTCRLLLESMWQEDFFISERPLGEVHDELSRRGYNYDRTAVSHSLSDLVREGLLSRTGTMRNYRYIQKRPSKNGTPNNTTAERQPVSS